MANGMLGRKIGMTSVSVGGASIPVTVIEAGPCDVVQVKSTDGPDKYDALQMGFIPRKKTRVNKPTAGHFKKANLKATRNLREFRDMTGKKAGQKVVVDELFEAGEMITVCGLSKGRGFTGVMKRHNFHGHKATHGTHESFRGPGSIGACAWPSKVVKGKRMAGQHGVNRITVKNLQVVEIISDKNLLLIKGAVPGARNSVVELIKQ
ncbi:50S ribosomal protein L3 [bacterium]|nr:50S ribosomal protein L3 [bacterium]